MPDRLLAALERWFDALEARWEGTRSQRALGTVLTAAFLAGVFVIELNQRGWLPERLSEALPTNHFGAVGFVFTLLLAVEIVGLVFALARSVAESLGKQFEVFALILLRKAFLEYARFGEPVSWPDVAKSLPHVLADLGGALLVFVLLGAYYRVQRHRAITSHAPDRHSFVRAKKAVSLLLLAVFAAMGLDAVHHALVGEEAGAFFASFYTVLVLSDILLVLVSMRYSGRFCVVFRNSGFAAATTIVRLALSAPPVVNALLGVGALAFAVVLSLAYNAFDPREAGGEENEATAPPQDAAA